MKEDLTISQMLYMQRELWERHASDLAPLTEQYGKDSFLWMIEEIGECISIIKKRGASAVVDDPSVRNAFTEELSDILKYYFDVLLRFGVSSAELSEAFQKKHEKNMNRNFKEEYMRKTL